MHRLGLLARRLTTTGTGLIGARRLSDEPPSHYADEIASLRAEQERPERKEPFQKWINYASQHQSDGDVLNRARVYFCRSDRLGHLFRCEHGQRLSGEHMGLIRDAGFLDAFWLNLRRNDTGMFADWPYVSRRGYERHYLQPSNPVAPVLISDVVYPDGGGAQGWRYDELAGWRLRYSPTNALPFDPAKLRIDDESDCLIYPCVDQQGALDDDQDESVVWASFRNDVARHLVDVLDGLDVPIRRRRRRRS